MLLLTMKKHKIFSYILVFMLFSCAGGSDDFQFETRSTTSQGGSLSKFTIKGNYLYVVEDNALAIFDITDFESATSKGKILINRNIETIFQFGNSLFLGTTTGMLIYDITDSENPVKLSEYNHITSCDPVVANEDYAFVTLRAGRTCGLGNNVLDIIDITDLENPQLVNSVNMSSPYGLGLLGDNLFVCENSNGLTQLNVTDVMNINQLANYPSINATDVIIRDSSILVAANNSIIQLQLTASNELLQISEYTYD